MSYTWLKKLSTLSAYGPGAGPYGWLTICPILYLPALTTSLVKFHLRPNHIVKFLSKVGVVFPEKNCPQTVEEALLIRFLDISSSFVSVPKQCDLQEVCSKIPADYSTYVRFRPNKTHCKRDFSGNRSKQKNLTERGDSVPFKQVPNLSFLKSDFVATTGIYNLDPRLVPPC